MHHKKSSFYTSFWKKFRTRLFHIFFLLSRPMTLGVRALVYDPKKNLIFLIRHTYTTGWHLPGGGVEVGETLEQALKRELMEETNIKSLSSPVLKGFYYNCHSSKRDHVALYLITHYHQICPKKSDSEIAEAAFFALNELPENITPATLRRIKEIFHNAEISEYW